MSKPLDRRGIASGPNLGDETVDYELMIYWDETLGSPGME